MDDENGQGPCQDERRDHDMILAFQGRIIGDQKDVDEMMAIKGHEGYESDEVDARLAGQTFRTLGSSLRRVGGGHEWASCWKDRSFLAGSFRSRGSDGNG